MSTNEQSKDAPDEPVYVEVLPGIVVPEQISRGYGFTEAGGGYVAVEIEVGTGRPCLRRLSVAFSDPPPLEDLAEIELERFGCKLSESYRIARVAFADEVQSTRLRLSGASMTSGAVEAFDLDPDADWGMVLDQDQFDGLRAEALDATVRRGGRPRVSDEAKLAILDAYESGNGRDIKAAMRVSGVGERQTRKHIAAAVQIREHAG